MTEKTVWKKCPKCDGFIPDFWVRHEKCGWGMDEPVKETEGFDTADKYKEDSIGKKITNTAVIKATADRLWKHSLGDAVHTEEEIDLFLKKLCHFCETRQWC